MVERRREASPSRRDRSELEASLRIDQDNLDSCLVEQPGFFHHVAEAMSMANADRDTIKLELEEVSAELDQSIRLAAARLDEKITEGSIQTRLRTMPRIQALQRKYLEAKTQADVWAALKEAYQQRSFMLRELVALQLSHVHNLGVERGAVSARHNLGDVNRERAEEVRRERRLSR